MQSSSPVYTSAFKMTMWLLNTLCLLLSKCCAGRKRKNGTKAKPSLKDWLYFSSKGEDGGVRFVHTALCKSAHLLPEYQWGYKKALENSTGKLSLWEGPAQTGRAGLGFPARGLGSFHCVYLAELGLDFHCTSFRYSHRITQLEKQAIRADSRFAPK